MLGLGRFSGRKMAHQRDAGGSKLACTLLRKAKNGKEACLEFHGTYEAETQSQIGVLSSTLI